MAHFFGNKLSMTMVSRYFKLTNTVSSAKVKYFDGESISWTYTRYSIGPKQNPGYSFINSYFLLLTLSISARSVNWIRFSKFGRSLTTTIYEKSTPKTLLQRFCEIQLFGIGAQKNFEKNTKMNFTFQRWLTVWSGTSSIGIIGSYFYENSRRRIFTLNSDRYRDIIHIFFKASAW